MSSGPSCRLAASIGRRIVIESAKRRRGEQRRGDRGDAGSEGEILVTSRTPVRIGTALDLRPARIAARERRRDRGVKKAVPSGFRTLACGPPRDIWWEGGADARMRMAAVAIGDPRRSGRAGGAAETVCRPTALGSVRCSGRRRGRSRGRSTARDVQALERVRQPAEPAERGDALRAGARDQPPRHDADRRARCAGRCRPDRLGNQHCR